MAKFIFKMENLLSIKYKLEDQAKAEYGREMELLRREEEKLAKLQEKRSLFQDKLRKAMVSRLDVPHIRELEDAVENMKYNIRLQEIAVANQQTRADKAREALDEAMKERKTYEKLKEKAFEIFRQEVNAEEQKEVDELVSFRFGNKEEREE